MTAHTKQVRSAVTVRSADCCLNSTIFIIK